MKIMENNYLFGIEESEEKCNNNFNNNKFYADEFEKE